MKPTTIPDQAIADALRIILQHLRPSSMSEATPLGNTSALNHIDMLQFQDDKILEIALDVFTHRVKHRIAAIRRQRNFISYLYRLPNEILAHTLGMISHNYSSRTDLRDVCHTVTEVTRVSSRLREVAVSTPQLWAHIDDRFEIPVIRGCLTWSKRWPLHIFFYGRREGGIPREELLLQLVIQHAARWESFLCETGHFKELHWKYLENTPLPRLQRFSLETEEIITEMPLPNSITHLTPNLKSLEIPYISFPFGVPCLRTLRSIQFVASIGEVPLTIAQWQSFLSSSPELESIVAYGGNEGLEEQVDPFRVSLPGLKRFTIVSMPVSTMGILLSSVSPGQDSSPLVTIEYPDERERGPYDAMRTMLPEPSSSPGLLSSMSSATTVGASCPRTGVLGVTVDINKKEVLKIKAEWEVDVASAFWSTLLPLVTLRNLKDIELHGGQFFKDGSFSSTIHLCTALERLSLALSVMKGGDSILMSICAGLSSSIINSGGHAYALAPCPRLKKLELRVPDGIFSPVYHLLRSRYGGHLASIADNRIHPLEALRLSSTDWLRLPSDHADGEHIVAILEILAPLKTEVKFVDKDTFTK
ncbi:hypothetical protein FRC02_004758 [Tulasnella sp. 418]|nr:hypothetical protein FRC02_004758 [Tulasnella sp. 418]